MPHPATVRRDDGCDLTDWLAERDIERRRSCSPRCACSRSTGRRAGGRCRDRSAFHAGGYRGGGRDRRVERDHWLPVRRRALDTRRRARRERRWRDRDRGRECARRDVDAGASGRRWSCGATVRGWRSARGSRSIASFETMLATWMTPARTCARTRSRSIASPTPPRRFADALHHSGINAALVSCTFCSKRSRQVRRLIAGPARC